MKALTKEQAAWIGAYTGICFGNFSDVHQKVEEVLGRPVFTHELADKEIWQSVRDKMKSEIKLIAYTGE